MVFSEILGFSNNFNKKCFISTVVLKTIKIMGLQSTVRYSISKGQDVPGQSRTRCPVVPLFLCPGTKIFPCPAVPLSRNKGRSKCPGTNSSVLGRPGTKWIKKFQKNDQISCFRTSFYCFRTSFSCFRTTFSVLEHHFSVLEHPFLLQNIIFCFRTSFSCFRTSFSALSRFVPRDGKGQAVKIWDGVGDGTVQDF